MSILSIQHLEKAYKGPKVIDDVSFDVEKGDIYGILGLSGAGKSTLVRCINGLERPTGGDILYNGNVISSDKVTPSKEVRQKIAMIFQSFNLLLQRTALDNVHLAFEISGVKDEGKEESKKLLTKVGLGDKFDSYPSQLSADSSRESQSPELWL
jgi:D-methionine transport system ATP-binding protein